MSVLAGSGGQLGPLIAIAPLLVAVGYFDLRYRRIPGLLSSVGFATFLVFAAIYPPTDLVPRLTVAAIVLGLGLVGLALRLFGDGDVKFLSTLVLFVPLQRLVSFADVFSLSLLLGIAVVLALRRLPSARTWGWKDFAGASKVPMGLSIALAGLSFPWVTFALG